MKFNMGTTSGQLYTPGQMFQPGETRTFQWFWFTPPTMPAGQYTIKIGVVLTSDLVVTATFAPLPAPPPSLITLDLDARPSPLRPGDTLHVGLTVGNPGATRTADVYLGMMLPASAGPSFGCPRGDAIAFVADGSSRVVVTCASAPASSFAPQFRGATLPGAMSAQDVPDVWTLVWQGRLPAGTYTVFAALTPPNAFADGQASPADLLAVAVREVLAMP